MNITTVQIKDHSKATVQLVTRSQPGSFVGVSILRYVNHHFQADNQLTPSRFLKALYQLEPFNRYNSIPSLIHSSTTENF